MSNIKQMMKEMIHDKVYHKNVYFISFPMVVINFNIYFIVFDVF